jgi:hypothetical protein
MKGFSRATSHGPEHEAHFQAQRAARLRLLNERAACSPRATVAFSALSTAAWLRKKLSGSAKLITGGKRCLRGIVPWGLWHITGRNGTGMFNYYSTRTNEWEKASYEN